ncbi:MAG: hypothetical protein NUV56_01805 [Candidatus Uhrbacteria bacterium]|nr:hypothetical protein [Candidatus Uhrbacteria bacterium]
MRIQVYRSISYPDGTVAFCYSTPTGSRFLANTLKELVKDVELRIESAASSEIVFERPCVLFVERGVPMMQYINLTEQEQSDFIRHFLIAYHKAK